MEFSVAFSSSVFKYRERIQKKVVERGTTDNNVNPEVSTTSCHILASVHVF
jgi:hypothetical protein